MRKINKILIGIILITTIFLCIGYSAIKNITLDIKGTISADPITYLTPSELFDEDGSDNDGLHIGDFVEYDAGIWTQEEIDAIQVGPTSNLVTASGSTELPGTNYEFGGFEAGSNRKGNAIPSEESDCDYVKDASTGEEITGWRVFDIEDDGTITLISAGNPEAYYYIPDDGEYAYQSEYVLSGNVNSDWSGADTSTYKKRDWSNYVNASQKATNATTLTKSRLDSWYSKYIVANADTSMDSTFIKIYEEPYIKYQNVVDNYSVYWLSTADNRDYGESMWLMTSEYRSVLSGCRCVWRTCSSNFITRCITRKSRNKDSNRWKHGYIWWRPNI